MLLEWTLVPSSSKGSQIIGGRLLLIIRLIVIVIRLIVIVIGLIGIVIRLIGTGMRIIGIGLIRLLD